ncbi:hypothetical protein Golomagni_02620 [Golovinomyces magnicellulatus]|nr:hypothetical protein Golomagni_02620 [Golovinomyces magnicellulatus]
MMPGHSKSTLDDVDEPTRGVLMLRRHKMLPHPMRQLDLSLDTSRIASNTSGTTSLRRLPKGTSAPNLPPTPPTHSRLSSESDQLASSPLPIHSGHNPPTPELTPPRPSRSTFSPYVHNLYQSSRSNSFITAPEDPYSSDEDDSSYVMMKFLPPSQTPNSCVTWSDSEPMQNEYEQESEEYHERKVMRPKIRYSESPPKTNGMLNEQGIVTSDEDVRWDITQEVDNFRGIKSLPKQWSNYQSTLPLYANEATERTTGAKFYLSTQPTEPSQIRHGEVRPKFYHHEADRVSIEEFIRSENSSTFSPHSSNKPSMPGQTLRSISASSSGRDAQPAYPKVLRHTKKQTSLRECSRLPNQSSGLVGDSVFSSTESPYSRNMSSATMSSKLSLSRRREIIKNGGIPVVVIPERISCSKPSQTPSFGSTISEKTQRSISLNSVSLSYGTWPQEPEYYDIPNLKGDLFSESAESKSFEFNDNYALSKSSTRSSLSLEKFISIPRTESLTAESLNAHNQLLAQNSDSQSNYEPCLPPNVSQRTLSGKVSIHRTKEYYGEKLPVRGLSDQALPNSQSSHETAGTAAEVSQALAVPFIPHQTRSIMVLPYPEPQDSISFPSAPSPEYIDEPKLLDADTHNTPLMSTFSISLPESDNETEQYFQDPQDLPQPPLITFIPPTPRTADKSFDMASESTSSGSELLERDLLSFHQEATTRTSEHAKPSLLSRAFSLGARTGHEDEYHNQKLAGDSASLTMVSLNDTVPDQTRLHPSWRPSQFGDESDELKYSFDYDEYRSMHRPQTSPKRTLSERLKKRIGVFPMQETNKYQSKLQKCHSHAGTFNKPNQIRENRVRPNYREDEKSDMNEDKNWGLNFKEGNGGRILTFPGLRISSLGWKEIRRWASEKKREKRRQELRNVIGEPKVTTHDLHIP